MPQNTIERTSSIAGSPVVARPAAYPAVTCSPRAATVPSMSPVSSAAKGRDVVEVDGRHGVAQGFSASSINITGMSSRTG